MFITVGWKCAATLKAKKHNQDCKQQMGQTQNTEVKINAETVLFFDMDGTLVDTNLSNFLSYKKAIQSVTKTDCTLAYNSDKRFNRSNLQIAVPNLSEADYNKIIKEKEEYYKDFLPETKLNTKIVDFLSKYSKTNKTVLVTNCREERAITTLNYFGLVEKFSNIFYREFTDNHEKINKFQNAILKLGVMPNLVVAFENEEVEIADARQAGIEIINPEII